MSAELFTVVTRPTPGYTRFQGSLSKFGVPVTILGQGEPRFPGFGWRWKTLIRAARASSASAVLFCDAYDTLCLDSIPNMELKFLSLSHPIVFSCDPQPQPEPWLSLNPGLMMADRASLLAFFDDETLEMHIPDHFNDMYQIQALYSWSPGAFKLDREGVLFHTVGRNSPELIASGGRLVNPTTGKSPTFVHGPYGWDLSRVEQWLATVN